MHKHYLRIFLFIQSVLPKIWVGLFLFALQSNLLAQDGPGGIGKTDGTSNLTLWLDANSLSLSDGAKVTNWLDLSGYTNDASAPLFPLESPVFRTNVLNGQPALSFGEAPDSSLLSIADNGSLNSNNLSVFIVGSFELASDNSAPYLTKSTNWNWDDGYGIVRNGSNSEFGFFADGFANATTPPAPIAPGGFNIYSGMNFFAGIFDLNVLFINEIQIGIKAYGVSFNNSNADLLIGASQPNPGNGNLRDYLTGKISEIIIRRSFSGIDRTIINNYLSAKYSIDISASGRDF